ncbi:MAG: CocE/NonD family hydrolase [Devosia sp.]
MSLGSFLLARAARLPRRLNRDTRERGITIRTRDGVGLETELFRPRPPGRYPTLLIRVPYGLRGIDRAAEIYAERGYNVVIQACRGTSKSEGTFDPLTHERDDGLDTLTWIKTQTWFDGRLGTTGASYLGYTQWAISDALPQHAAIAVKVTSAEFRTVVFPGGSFHLGLWLGWIQVMEGLRQGSGALLRGITGGSIEKRSLKASMEVPLLDADKRITGHEIPFWRKWLTESIGSDKFWRPLDHTHRLGMRTPPTSFVSGWYDFMLDQLLRDYETLAEANGHPYLTIGPWVHVSPQLQYEGMRDTYRWMNAKLKGDASGLRDKPVRLWIGGRNRWYDLDAYPPAAPDIELWHLHSGQTLTQKPPDASAPDTYRYDPADPTPSLGGAMFAFTGAGPLDQATLESRSDVLVFTSGQLNADVSVIGSVRAIVHMRTSLSTTDLFVKLCDVDEKGVSTNICDGIVRLGPADKAPADGIRRINLKLHATAHSFLRNHRIRLQVSSGAHPRFARNLGTDEPPGTATRMEVAEIEIFHDPAHPSAIHLPVYDL